MAPALLERRALKFKAAVRGNPRVNVSEFARSKTWRGTLKDEGYLEIVERGDTIGYVMDVDWAKSLADYIDEINEERELSSIRAMYEARKDSEFLSGDELKAKGLAYMDEHEDEIRRVFHECQQAG